MAFAHIVYKYILNEFSDVVDGLSKTSRLKKFIFRIINIVARYTGSAGQVFIHLASDNTALVKLADSP